MRIISTVPSLTELLSALGLDDALCGITKFCVHPEHIYRSKTRVGGTKDLKLDLIRSLEPTLIIANKEENDQGQIEALQADCEVLLTDIKDLDSALEAILHIGEKTGTLEAAQLMVKRIQVGFDAIKASPKHKVLYLIWQEPYMSVGHDTFIHDMLRRCGMESVCADAQRYPEIEPGQLEPEIILASSEPFPFNEKHLAAIAAHWPAAKVKLVDGEFFSWYGSRLVEAPKYFQGLIKALA